MELLGLILAPDIHYQTGSIHDLSPEIWTDALSSKVISSINVTRTFLPLLVRYQSRILVLTPNIIHALKPVQNAIESVSVAALEAFTETLRRETSLVHVQVSQLKLGAFNFGPVNSPPRSLSQDPNLAEYRMRHWITSSKGSHTRELHHVVFDALTMKNPFATRHVGRGSLTYALVGTLVPSSWVDWMLSGKQSAKQDLSKSIAGWERIEQDS